MFQRWPKRDPNKHYYLVPNEVFNLGLTSHEIAVYNYLLRCEDRRTYQCHPSYRTIGRAVRLSENTVRKYVTSLEEKGLIRTEPSTITTKDGRVRNGSLIYTIRPIQEALELNYQRQFLRAERDIERAKAEKKLAKQEGGKRMMQQLANFIVDHDPLMVLRRTHDTVRYIRWVWNKDHADPIDEEELRLFLCDEHYGDLTDEQKTVARRCRDGMRSVYAELCVRLLQREIMLEQGMVPDSSTYCSVFCPEGGDAPWMLDRAG